MALSRVDENELLTALHSGGVREDEPWKPFVSRLRARTRADLCGLFLRSGGDSEWIPLDVASTPAGDTVIGDTWGARFTDMRSGRVYSESDLGDEQGRSERHLRVALPDEHDVGLSLVQQRGDLGAAVSSLMSSLAPHIAIAVRTHLELQRERSRRLVAERVLACHSTSWLLVDARGRIVDGSLDARQSVAAGRVMRCAADGRLRFPSHYAEELLETVLAERTVAEQARAAWLSFDPPTQMVAMRPPEHRAYATRPHCLLVLRRVESGDLGAGRHLQHLFRLTRSEAALAAEIAKGTRIAEAGEILGLTTETVRDYSKKIYVKLQARGQSDVARLVLNGVSVIA